MDRDRTWFALLRIAAGAVWLFQAYPKFRQSYLAQGFAEQLSAMILNNPWHFYRGLLQSVVLTHAPLFAYLTLIGDALVGICLLLGLFTPYAAVVGLFLNVNYALAAGWMSRTDYSLNAMLIVAELLILAVGAGKVMGLDGAFSSSGNRRRFRSF